jgi:hypothetical protein
MTLVGMGTISLETSPGDMAVENIGSLIAMSMTIILVPWVLGRMPYFRRPDVVARRIAKSQLPGWVSFLELIFFGVSIGVLIVLFILVEEYAHRSLHQGRDMLASAPPASSFGFIFWLIQILATLILALPLGMLMANLISWLILPIRKIEDKVMAEGVPGYTWHDLNYGLIKFCLLASPVCAILIVISLRQI